MLRGVIIFYLIDNMLGKSSLPSPAISWYRKKLSTEIKCLVNLLTIHFFSGQFFQRQIFANTVGRKCNFNLSLRHRRNIYWVGICRLQGRYFAHTKMHLNDVSTSCFHFILIMYFVYEYQAFGLEIVVGSIAV